MPDPVYPQHVLDAYSAYLAAHPTNTPPQSGVTKVYPEPIEPSTAALPVPMTQNMFNWMAQRPTDVSIREDIQNPRRFVDFKDIPNAEQTAISIAHYIDGPKARPYFPQHIGIYGSNYPMSVYGSTDTNPPYNSKLSAEEMLALMTKDSRTRYERNPNVFSDVDIEKYNPNIKSDPTSTAQSTFAHELTHQYIKRRQLQYQDHLAWQRENPQVTSFQQELFNQFDPDAEQATHPVDLSRLQALQKNFQQPWFNSHATSTLPDIQAASILGHQIGAEQLGIHP